MRASGLTPCRWGAPRGLDGPLTTSTWAPVGLFTRFNQFRLRQSGLLHWGLPRGLRTMALLGDSGECSPKSLSLLVPHVLWAVSSSH